MSIGDALAAIHIISTAVSKVKDNKDELNSLSNRLQIMVQSLEESRERDVVRDTEYDASLSTAFELITRTERLTQRMLKRSLGDRTWNAREVASDLRRLNDEAQTFLTIHNMKTLDLVRTSQTQQETFLASSVEEIIAQVAELSILLSKPRPAPPSFAPDTPAKPSAISLVQEGPANASTGSSIQSIGSSTARSPSWARRPFNALSTALTAPPHPRGVEMPAKAAILGGDGQQSNESDGIIEGDVPRSENVFSLSISGLRQSGKHTGPVSLEKTFTVPGWATIDYIQDVIEKAGYQRPVELTEDDTLTIQATEGDSVFDATSPQGLQISNDEPLLWWMNKYDEYHGTNAGREAIPMQTEVDWERESLRLGDLFISCRRTLRVPDTDKANLLPPDLGPFPFFPVAQLGSSAPEEMKKRGGFITPMFRREALWIAFQYEGNSNSSPAVKVSVGGVNVISGKPASDSASSMQHGSQDYVVAARQPWIDGVVTGPDVVRQFVVAEMHKGHTIEEQVNKKAEIGGLQFDIYPRRAEPLGCFYKTKQLPGQDKPGTGDRVCSVTAKPSELQLEQQTIVFVRDPSSLERRSAEWSLSGYARRISSRPMLKAKYEVDWTPMFRMMPVDWSVDLGIAAGGKIKQKIYRDENSVRVYNEQLAQRFHIHIVTPETWENLTGILPPATPITPDMYAMLDIPWVDLFDDYAESINGAGHDPKTLGSVLSVSELDKSKSKGAEKPKEPVVNPDSPPFCFQHSLVVSSCVFRPCGHAVCAQCLGPALLGGSKCSCGSLVNRFVGMKQPLPQVKPQLENEEESSDDGMQHWSVQEIERLSMHAIESGKVIVIHRAEDSVAPLQQKNPVSTN